MAKQYGPITVTACVQSKDGGLLDVDEDLTPEQKRELATWLSVRVLNSVFAGKVQFAPAGALENRTGTI